MSRPFRLERLQCGRDLVGQRVGRHRTRLRRQKDQRANFVRVVTVITTSMANGASATQAPPAPSGRNQVPVAVVSLAPFAMDVVITGHDRDEIGALIFLSPQAGAMSADALADKVRPH